MKKILFIAIILFGRNLFAADLFVNKEPRAFTPGEKLESNATIGGYPIWNGENNWRIFGLSRGMSGGTATSIPIGYAGLFQTEGGKLVAVMRISSNLSQGSASDWTDEPCKRDDMLYKNSLGGKFKDALI